MDDWPPGNEGQWVVVPLGDDFAVCQWECLHCQLLWANGIRAGVLKVIRIVPPGKLVELLAHPTGPAS
jgi:hypothetical protein